MAIQLRVLNSMDKVFPDKIPSGELTALTAFQNEPFSFQIAYRGEANPQAMIVRVESDVEEYLTSYRVDYVPLRKGYGKGFWADNLGAVDREGPGLYPDPLLPRLVNPPIIEGNYPWHTNHFEENEKNILYAMPDCWGSVWFSVNEDGKGTLAAGEHFVNVSFFDRDENKLGEAGLKFTVLPAKLPEQTLLYTNWLHCDCICDAHHVEPFSDRFYTILGDYVHKAVINGQNMFMLPAFTPPLDTGIGRERKCVQLMKITREGDEETGNYIFDFSEMNKYIDVCKAAGATHLEHAHLFTQWGAKHAPAIYATVDGERKRIFGWETDALGVGYTRFLRQYIPAVRAFLREEGMEDKTLFHISDEPDDTKLKSYSAAREIVKDALEGCMVGDALSHFEYYKMGLCSTPIVATDSVGPYLGNCDTMWCYYTGAQVVDNLSNRTFTVTGARNRMMGWEMYRYNMLGFLDWGLNYYYDIQSFGYANPYIFPEGFGGGDGGAYIAYPGDNDDAVQSLRQKVFGEGVVDMRALQLLESLSDRETVEKLIDEQFGSQLTFNTKAPSNAKLLAMREAVNKAIAERL